MLAPGSWNEVRVLKHLRVDLPEGSDLDTEKRDTDSLQEDLLEEAAGIHLKPFRKKNSKRAIPPWSQALRKYVRKRVETSEVRLTPCSASPFTR